MGHKRKKITVSGKRIYKSHHVWNLHNPNDLVKPGEVIHYKDDDYDNDAYDNLEKILDSEHRSIHSKAGTEALLRWKRENPEKAKAQSSLCGKKMNEILNSDPIRLKEVKEKRKIGIIKANKLRKGEKRSEEFKKTKSDFFKKYWADSENKRKRSKQMKEIWKKRKKGR